MSKKTEPTVIEQIADGEAMIKRLEEQHRVIDQKMAELRDQKREIARGIEAIELKLRDLRPKTPGPVIG